jgi:hypothetical protein
VRLNAFKNAKHTASVKCMFEKWYSDVEAPSGIRAAAQRGDEQEAAPLEPAVVAPAAKAANAGWFN